MKNVILYLIGFPGVGKLSTAREMCRRYPSFKVIDNHIPADVIFSFSKDVSNLRHGEYRDKVRRLMLEAIAELARPEESFILTNVLFRGENSWYEDVRRLAEKRSSLFIPVVLTCARDENKRRIASPARLEKFKTLDEQYVDEAFCAGCVDFDHPNRIVLDTTFLSIPEAADRILKIAEEKVHARDGI